MTPLTVDSFLTLELLLFLTAKNNLITYLSVML